jgi:hypothetical protein
MTVGFGMSIGTVNSVCAATAGDRDRPAVRVRRTAVTFDSGGGAQIGGIPRSAPVATDFADLTREPEPVVGGGRSWTPADLVAAVATCLIGTDEPAAGPVLGYPGCYTDRHVRALRHALDRSGCADVMLMPEPVAAVEWLDAEFGVSETGLTLVYDLGGNSLDVAVVRTEADRGERGVLGKAVRSYDYGGRPLGDILARYARALAPGAPSPVSTVVPAGDTTRLRIWHVRNSLRPARACVHAAGLTMRDIDRVLLVGGATRAPEVADIVAELGPPVVMPPDPAHTAAVGAAIASARFAGTGTGRGRHARAAAVVSSAAVASALAVSAAGMLGGGPIGTEGPVLEFAPARTGPADAMREHLPELWLPDGAKAAWGASAGGDRAVPAPLRMPGYYGPVAQAFSALTTAHMEHALQAYGPGTYCDPNRPGGSATYANPAQFTNPLPFYPTAPATATTTPASATGGGSIPSVSLPASRPQAEYAGDQHVSPAPTSLGTGSVPAPGGVPASGSSLSGAAVQTTRSRTGATTPSEAISGTTTSGDFGGTATATGGSTSTGRSDSGRRPSSGGSPAGGVFPGGLPSGGFPGGHATARSGPHGVSPSGSLHSGSLHGGSHR